MSGKKIETILSLIEVSEKNLKNAKTLLLQLTQDKSVKIATDNSKTPGLRSKDEDGALEVVEGYFDGENMIGDNGQIYPVPQNYASKTQLVIGDRMKWILTSEREIFKLIQPTARIRVTGTFSIEGDNFVVLVDEYPNSIKILKASATYAMKNLGLKPGHEVAIYVPKEATPVWGAFISVVKPNEEDEFTKNIEPENKEKIPSAPEELDELADFKLVEGKPASESDFF